MITPAIVIGEHDYEVVAVSVVVAVLTSFAALQLAARASLATGGARTTWLIAGAVTQGIGLWAMHYTGMLAFTLPVPTRYDWRYAFLSLVLGIASAALAVWTVNRRPVGAGRIALSALLMAYCIVGLHYTAMASMRPAADYQYSPWLVIVSALVAFVFALLSLWWMLVIGSDPRGPRLRQVAGALQMGAAICVMHYTAMAAATFTRTDATPDWSYTVSISALGAFGLGSSAIAVIGAAVLVSMLDRRRQSARELQRSLEQLRAFASRLERVREEERTRLAREIHDQLGQALTGIKIQIMSVARRQSLPAANVEGILKLVDDTIQRVRRIATELRPRSLDLGLVAAVEWAAEEFQTRTGVTCHLDVPEDDVEIDGERATALFRILQETLTNVTRHALATEVHVRLAVEDGSLVLEIRDNGRGIEERAMASGRSLGILGMRERTLLLGGDLTIHGRPGAGTTVRVRLPMRE